MTIFTRQKALPPLDREKPYVFDKSTVVMIEHSWKHVLAIARNQMDQLDLHNDTNSTSASFYRQQPLGTNTEDNHAHAQHRILFEELGQFNGLYDRERLMIHALDTLFSVAGEGSGYIVFLATMVQLLDPDCPVSMAFLSHVVDRATLPSKTTMARVSSALLSRLGFKYVYNHPLTLDGDNKKWRTSTPKLACEFGSHVDGRMKRNFLVILAILAEKFAGEMVHLLWTPDISVILFHFLASNDETWTVRVFALLALEKFALTGDIKSSILQHPLHIQNTLRQTIQDSKFGEQDNMNDNVHTKSKDDVAFRTGLSAIFNTFRKRPECVDWISTCMQKLAKRKTTVHDTETPSYDNHLHQQSSSRTGCMDIDKLDKDDGYDMYSDDDDDGGNLSDANDTLSRYGLTEQEDQENAIKDRGYSFDSSWTTEGICTDTTKSLIRLDSLPQNDVMKRMELALCAEWSLGHVFNNTLDKCGPSTWDLSGLNVIVNPFDATQHWKLGTNGLELRNDRLYFESIRATACVKKGRWYYEVLLVTEGIMQIGWCTNRCRFVPEDGYGVGDDQHGFAFDTYRSAVWANGSVVYPQQHNPQYKCRAGDVLGSYLDMDQGICSFYVNGKDVGSTVAFEHASSGGRTAMEGLFPAFSLTTHQHILVNFGDQPWMYLPDNLILASATQHEWKGINQADSMTPSFRQQLKDGVHPVDSFDDKRKNDDSATTDTATLCSTQSNISKHCTHDDPMNDDDWDGPLCTMCFNEPKDTNLIPCGHGSWGATCTKILVSCPLCRSKIEGFTKCVDQE